MDEAEKHHLGQEYIEAHDLYVQGLNYCTQYDLKEHRVDVRIKCAVVCLERKMYYEAYNYSMECVRLDENNQLVRI